MYQEGEKEDVNSDWWRPAVFFYAKVTSWIVIPLLIGVWLGGHTSFLLGHKFWSVLFLIAAFFVTCFGIYKEIKDYQYDLKNKEENGTKKNDK